MSRFPITLQGRISYEAHWDGCDIRGEVYLPQELTQKFMDLLEEIQRFSVSDPM